MHWSSMMFKAMVKFTMGSFNELWGQAQNRTSQHRIEARTMCVRESIIAQNEDLDRFTSKIVLSYQHGWRIQAKFTSIRRDCGRTTSPPNHKMNCRHKRTLYGLRTQARLKHRNKLHRWTVYLSTDPPNTIAKLARGWLTSKLVSSIWGYPAIGCCTRLQRTTTHIEISGQYIES